MKPGPANILIVFLILVLFPCTADSSGFHREYCISGRTMGTFYNVRIYTKKELSPTALKNKINVQLKMINRSMSIYINSSEISKFNRAPANTPVHISSDFYKVIKESQRLYKITDHAWDGTIGPLHELWNFSNSGRTVFKIPEPDQIRSCLLKTGFNNILIMDKTLTKKIPGLTLDLGSVAKGYGVDKVSLLLTKEGFNTFSVEIGGEVYAAGQKSQKSKWKIGLGMPEQGYNTKPFKVLSLSDMAVATSGTYADFYRINKKTYSHIINPKTGRPVDNNIASVSVIAENCTMADGLATALMVMGPEKGTALINTLENIECMLVIKKGKTEFIPVFSRGFKKYLN